jgi:hypothetical protein
MVTTVRGMHRETFGISLSACVSVVVLPCADQSRVLSSPRSRGVRARDVLKRSKEIDCRVPLEWAGVIARDAKYGRMFNAAMNEFISTARDALNGLR